MKFKQIFFVKKMKNLIDNQLVAFLKKVLALFFDSLILQFR
jgi:hypothetical protein